MRSQCSAVNGVEILYWRQNIVDIANGQLRRLVSLISVREKFSPL